MGQAVIVGVAFLALALILFNIGPAAAMLLVTAIIGVAVAELYAVQRQAGYEPVTLAGIVGSVCLVISAYNYGTAAVPTVLFLTTVVCLLWYLVGAATRSEEHTSELQSLMRISYAVFCLKKKKTEQSPTN